MNDPRIARTRGQWADQLSALPSQLRVAEVLVGWEQLNASCCRNSACMECPGPPAWARAHFWCGHFSRVHCSGGAQAQGGAGRGGAGETDQLITSPTLSSWLLTYSHSPAAVSRYLLLIRRHPPGRVSQWTTKTDRSSDPLIMNQSLKCRNLN